jgi:hypothetical protein
LFKNCQFYANIEISAGLCNQIQSIVIIITDTNRRLFFILNFFYCETELLLVQPDETKVNKGPTEAIMMW